MSNDPARTPPAIRAYARTRQNIGEGVIRAERITVDGTQLRYSDATPGDFKSNPANPPAFASLPGQLASVPAYYNAANGIVPGVVYGTEASGVRAATAAEFANPEGFILTNGSGGILAATSALVLSSEPPAAA